MKKNKWIVIFALAAALSLLGQPSMAGDIIKNRIDHTWLLEECKKPTDDPRPYFKKLMDKAVSPGFKAKLSHDIEDSKQTWEAAIGFKTPDVVGKVAPEIKPGKYTLADKDKYPFDKLMPKILYDRYNEPGAQGTNFAGNFTEFEIIPPRQIFMAKPVGDATIQYAGEAQLDDKGYLDYDTYKLGFPFPKPSGPQKGWQVLYNYVETNAWDDDSVSYEVPIGVNSSFREDYRSSGYYYQTKLSRRVRQAPYGMWYDKRAEKNGEKFAMYFSAHEPRDVYGNAWLQTKYVNPDKLDNFLLYTTLTRRIRKLSSSDTQDQSVGVETTFDDTNQFSQKLSPKVYPYEVRVIGEGEFLMQAYDTDGSMYVDSKAKYQVRGMKLERRPCYVIEMKQLDPNYIYSKRISYVDKETFMILIAEYYDQQGRLWRTGTWNLGYIPEHGVIEYLGAFQWNHIDVHSTFSVGFGYPAEDMQRGEFSPKRLMRQVK